MGVNVLADKLLCIYAALPYGVYVSLAYPYRRRICVVTMSSSEIAPALA